MKVEFLAPTLPQTGSLVVGVLEGKKLTPAATEVDQKTNGLIQKALASNKFTGKEKTLLAVVAPAGLEVSRIVLVGLGKKENLSMQKIEDIAGTVIASVLSTPDTQISFHIDGHGLDEKEVAAHLGFGALLRTYRFDKYKTKEKPEDKSALKKISILTSAEKEAAAHYADLEKVAEGIFFTRDVVSEPPNVLYPESYAKRIKELESLGLKVEILDEKKMKSLGMEAILSVGQGSEKESQMVAIEWHGGNKGDAPLGFIGKGVTFDTGGISIKPSKAMDEMKFDMGGSATVVGLMKALAGRKAKVNAVGVVGLVENMPSGSAYRPGDIIGSMSGQTIEVLNTDAEGRIVLADVLWYTQDKYKPKFMIDLATLTGAIIVCLGHEKAGIFSDSDELADRLFEAGNKTGENVWRLPIGPEYDKQLDSKVADMKNIGGAGGGSITAAQFLKRFTNNVPWLHIDIAGTAWSDKPLPTADTGATGFGVKLLNQFVADHYE